MAMSIRALSRLNISFVNCAVLKPNFLSVGVRYLYTEKDLGVVSYENARYVYRNQFMTIENTFREKMREICDSTDGVVYTEDLKAMLHLAKNTTEDLNLIRDMMVKYYGENEEKISSFVFIPVLLRMYYHLNQPQCALNIFEDEKFEDKFDVRSAYRVLMCLLYKHNMFKEMRMVHEKIVEKKGIEFVGPNNVIVFAACLKEDTDEAFQYAMKYWKMAHKEHSARSCCITAYLATKHDGSEVALEILTSLKRERSPSALNIKILAYLNLKRHIQIIPVLKSILEQDLNNTTKIKIFSDVMSELNTKFESGSIQEENEQLLNLINHIKSQEFVDLDNTLEQYMLKPVSLRRKEKTTTDNYNRRRSRFIKPEMQNYL